MANITDNKISILVSYDEPDYLANRLTSSDRNGVTRFSTYGSNTSVKYNEKPIDVPVDFERDAYARVAKHNRGPIRRKLRAPVRHLSPTLEDFLQVKLISINNISHLI